MSYTDSLIIVYCFLSALLHHLETHILDALYERFILFVALFVVILHIGHHDYSLASLKLTSTLDQHICVFLDNVQQP